MKELLELITTYARGMWHRRWAGLAMAWLVAVVGVAIVYRIPERFEAAARVYVDTESLLRPLLAGLAVQPNVDQQVSLMSRTLISRPNIEKLVRQTDLDLGARTPAERDALIDEVMRTVRLSNLSANLYTISYRDSDPNRARRVVQSLLGIFVESGLGDKKKDTQSAVSFLDEQIGRYEESLRAAEDRLKGFKLTYMGVSSAGGGAGGATDYFGKIAMLQGQVEGARLELQTAEQMRDSYKRELAGETPTLMPETRDTPMSAAGPASLADGVPEVDSRIATLRAELDSLLRRYTEFHPDVVGAKRMIERLEEQRRATLEARRKSAPPPGPGRADVTVASAADRNPVFQQLRLSLASAEANVAAARAKVNGYEQQYQSLRAQAALVPQAEAEFSQLMRDYNVQKKTYENLLTRREAAMMGKDVQDTGGAQFRVIDPPRVSPQPVAPNRVALLAIAIVAALGAGLVASFVVSQLLPTFHDSRTLRDVTKRPFLGMVSMLPDVSVARMRRRTAYLFAGGLGGLLAAMAGVVAFALLVGRAV